MRLSTEPWSAIFSAQRILSSRRFILSLFGKVVAITRALTSISNLPMSLMETSFALSLQAGDLAVGMLKSKAGVCSLFFQHHEVHSVSR